MDLTRDASGSLRAPDRRAAPGALQIAAAQLGPAMSPMIAVYNCRLFNSPCNVAHLSGATSCLLRLPDSHLPRMPHAVSAVTHGIVRRHICSSRTRIVIQRRGPRSFSSATIPPDSRRTGFSALPRRGFHRRHNLAAPAPTAAPCLATGALHVVRQWQCATGANRATSTDDAGNVPQHLHPLTPTLTHWLWCRSTRRKETCRCYSVLRQFRRDPHPGCDRQPSRHPNLFVRH